MNDLAPTSAVTDLERHVAALTPAVPSDVVLATYDRIQFYAGELARMKKLCETAMVEWIRANGDLEVGNGIRYYAGATKTTKCVDVAAAVAEILEACGGDFGKLCETLSANAIKHGAAKKLLPPPVHARLFVVEVRDSLEEGASKLKKTNDNF